MTVASEMAMQSNNRNFITPMTSYLNGDTRDFLSKVTTFDGSLRLIRITNSRSEKKNAEIDEYKGIEVIISIEN